MFLVVVCNVVCFGSIEGVMNVDVEWYIFDFMFGMVDLELIDVEIKSGGIFDMVDDDDLFVMV